MIDTSMTEALGRFLDVDVARYKLISTNLANIDTPGYHTRDLDFRAELRRAAAEDSGLEGGQLVSASFAPFSHSRRAPGPRADGAARRQQRQRRAREPPVGRGADEVQPGRSALERPVPHHFSAINSGGTTS